MFYNRTGKTKRKFDIFHGLLDYKNTLRKSLVWYMVIYQPRLTNYKSWVIWQIFFVFLVKCVLCSPFESIPQDEWLPRQQCISHIPLWGAIHHVDGIAIIFVCNMHRLVRSFEWPPPTQNKVTFKRTVIIKSTRVANYTTWKSLSLQPYATCPSSLVSEFLYVANCYCL